MCKEGESILNLYWSPNKPILREAQLKYFGNSNELDEQKHNNLNNILSIFTEAITIAPYLQLPYLLRAKTFIELGNFESALNDAKCMTITNSVNLRGSMMEKVVALSKSEHVKKAYNNEKGESTPEGILLEKLGEMANEGNDDHILETRTEIGNVENERLANLEGALKHSNPKLAYSIITTQKILIDRLRKDNISYSHLISAEDLKCQLCYTLLIDPVNCPCGHIYCRSCLLASLKCSDLCPMCRSILPQIGYFLLRPSCKFIEKVIELYKPKLEESEVITTPLFISRLGLPGSRLSFRMFEKRDRVIIPINI
jgi:hypothetical protein